MLCPDLLDGVHLTVVEEGAEQTAVQVVQDGDQEMLVELKRIRELQHKQRTFSSPELEEHGNTV